MNHEINTVGVWGHYHGKNLGDDIVVATILQNLESRLPNARFVGFSLDPEDTSSRHQIQAYSIQVGMPSPVQPHAEGKALSGKKHPAFKSDLEVPGASSERSSEAEPTAESGPSEAEVEGKTGFGDEGLYERLRRWIATTEITPIKTFNNQVSQALSGWRMRQSLSDVDMLIVAGSGPFFDGWTGHGGHPTNLLRWSQFSRNTGTHFVPLCVGAGPIYEQITRNYLRQTIENSAYKSYRDPYSSRLMQDIGAPGPYPVFPDLAFGLSPRALTDARRDAPHIEGTVVGVSTMAFKDPRYTPRSDIDQYREYRDKLVSLVAWLLETDLTPVLLRSSRSDDRVAVDVVDGVREQGVKTDRIILSPTRTYQDLLAQIAACDVVVGGRFHCHVLPFLLGVPVLGLAYHPKTSDMMAYMGQSDFCLDIDKSELSEITRHLQTLIEERNQISAQIQPRVEVCREAVWMQYDALVNGQAGDLTGSYLPEHDRAPAVVAR